MAEKLSVLQRLKQLDAERNKLLDEAKKEALQRAEQAVAELNELGFSYQLLEPGARRQATAEPGSKKGTRTVKDAPCPICHFKTEPLHDGRSHRTQETKKPFSDEELATRGFRKT